MFSPQTLIPINEFIVTGRVNRFNQEGAVCHGEVLFGSDRVQTVIPSKFWITQNFFQPRAFARLGTRLLGYKIRQVSLHGLALQILFFVNRTSLSTLSHDFQVDWTECVYIKQCIVTFSVRVVLISGHLLARLRHLLLNFFNELLVFC